MDFQYSETDELPLVSCVIIFFDAERFLAEAIESVLSQDYPNWELILVDDGSGDQSRAIAAAYQQRLPDRIKLIMHTDHRNRGKSASRNVGIREAGGEFIALLDSDDVWFPCKLREQVRLLRGAPEASFAYGPVQYWYSWTGRARDMIRDRNSAVPWVPPRIVDPPDLLTRLVWTDISASEESICPYPSSVIFKRALFHQTGGFDEDFAHIYDDTLFFAKVFAVSKVLVYEQVLARYRLHSDARWSNSYQNAIAAGMWHPTDPSPAKQQFFARVRAHVNALAINNRQLQRALNEAERPWRRSVWRSLDRPYRQLRKRLGRFVRQTLRTLPSQRRWSFIRLGEIRWGDLGQALVDTDDAAIGRGGSIGTAQVDKFLAANAHRLTGDVGEFGDDALIRRYGSKQVRSIKILDPRMIECDEPSHQNECFDCLLAIDLLRFADDPRRAVRTLYQLLRPGGIVIASLPGLVPTASNGRDRWRWTVHGSEQLFAETFGKQQVIGVPYGSLRTVTASIHNLGVHDVETAQLSSHDPALAVQIFILAQRRTGAPL